MPIYFGSNFAKEPFQFDSVGNDWEQESVNRPNGFPLYHYLQTQEGVGVVTIYDQKTLDHGSHDGGSHGNSSYDDNLHASSSNNTSSLGHNSQIGHTIELQKGQGILIAPYVAHSYHNKSDSISNHLYWKTEFATFTGTMEPAFKDMFNKDGYWLIEENKGKELSAAISRAVQHFKERGNDTRTLSLDCYGIMLLLSDQTNYVHGKDDPNFARFIKPVVDAIEEHYMDDISAKELADGVFVSQQYLSRIFTEFMNCSVYEYLTNYRINKAKELLLINSKRKIQDIAADVGYSDASHFIVMFKKLSGMTPAQFRKLHI